MKVEIRSSGTPYFFMMSGRAWQPEQVSGMFFLEVGAPSSSGEAMPCSPWQSTQRGDSTLPARAWAPWMLSLYSSKTSRRGTGRTSAGCLAIRCGSPTPRMSWTPWQSVQTAANRTRPFLEEGPAVDALHVFLVGLLAMDVVLGDDAHVLVAGGAHQGDVLAVDRGLGVGSRPDVVLAVAVPAPGHLFGVPLEVGPAVDAVPVREGAHPRRLGALLAMALRRAIGRGNGRSDAAVRPVPGPA